MPETPQLKKFPYDTEIRCKVCHPADREEPPFMQCREERARPGNQVQRVLECPNCGERDDDIFDLRLNRVVFNRDLDDAAARGGKL
jgi:hypothetical protein